MPVGTFVMPCHAGWHHRQATRLKETEQLSSIADLYIRVQESKIQLEIRAHLVHMHSSKGVHAAFEGTQQSGIEGQINFGH